jgi:uridine kinase
MNTNTVTPFIVGITGGSASGKTKFMNSLLGAFSTDEICQVSQDDYYKPITEIPRDNNGVENFDLPETIDYTMFAEHIRMLRNGESVEHREYTFNNPDVIPCYNCGRFIYFLLSGDMFVNRSENFCGCKRTF